jgi:phosphoribosylformylglycinamidine synthase
VLEKAAQAVGLAMPAKGDLVLIGETQGWLGQSLWLREIAGREEGAPPPVHLAAERRNGDFVRARILAGEVLASHDCADGGLLVAVAEMAMGSSIGARLAPPPEGTPAHGFWFGEDQARYVLAVADGAALIAKAKAAGVPARLIGTAGGGDLVLPDGTAISVSTLAAAHEATLPTLMGES